MTPDFAQAAAYVTALTGEPVDTARVWWRCIHDTDLTVPGHKYYGTLAEHWQTLCDYNSRGYGIFANINAFAPDTKNHNLADVWYCRTSIIDLDNVLTSQQNYQLASAHNPAPSFAVQSSPSKFHLYWTVEPYQGNDRYNVLQRKLRQLYDGDKAVIDPTRVLRVPGFYNHKYSTPGGKKFIPGAAPSMVTCWSLAGYGARYDVSVLEQSVAHVNVIDTGGGRHALGDAELSAPSLDWLKFGLSLIDPNELDRGEWISTSAAFKQAGWLHASDEELYAIWSEWCARYAANDPGENHKQWHSVRDTEVGWNSFKRRAPTLIAYEKFGFKEAPQPVPPPTPVPQLPAPSEPEEAFADILSEYECQRYFKNCFFIERMGQILTPRGRFMNSTQFNGAYGGKLFVITPDGKTTDEPWKAALRSTLWTIPKIDHVRFVPLEPQFKIIEDQMGRKGVNTYIPIRIRQKPGDITPFLRHMELMFPVESDRQIIYSYLAHNVKFPGFKIPWAPMIQSAEGVGKGFIIKVVERILGNMYVYRPKAEELVKSGSTFNSWQRGKLMIVVDEIKVDERRELIEILKPLITEERAEIQSKGVDQDMEDNPANWLFFSNWKDAIPVTQNGRRYSIFFSVIQSVADLISRGMDDAYFTALFTWLETGGDEVIAHWLLNYPIELGQIARRAPDTSSRDEAIKVSRSPVDRAILNAIDDGLPGFKCGYISVLAVINRVRQLGGRSPAQSTVERILETMGYHHAGRATRSYAQESMNERATIYTLLPGMPASDYGRFQGYE